MGYRTVVILNNDHSHLWRKNPNLGQLIDAAIHSEQKTVGDYGRVVECVHADVQTLLLVDSLSAAPVASSVFFPGETTEQIKKKLLLELAAETGYTLIRSES
jgi:hypothetical protein